MEKYHHLERDFVKTNGMLSDQQNIITPLDILWRHEMETFSTLLDLCDENPPVTSEFNSQRASDASFVVSFDVSMRKQPNK